MFSFKLLANRSEIKKKNNHNKSNKKPSVQRTNSKINPKKNSIGKGSRATEHNSNNANHAQKIILNSNKIYSSLIKSYIACISYLKIKDKLQEVTKHEKMEEKKNSFKIFDYENVESIEIQKDLSILIFQDFRKIKYEEYKKKLSQENVKIDIHKDLIHFIITGILRNKNLRSNPILVFFEIYNLTEKGEYNEAALTMIRKRKTFIYQTDEVFIAEIVHLQLALMRRLFNLLEFQTLIHLGLIDFTEKSNMPDIKVKYLIMSAVSCISCNYMIHAIEQLKKVNKIKCSSKKKAKANCLLGLIYQHLFLKNNNNDYKKLSDYFFRNAIKENQCFWTMIASICVQEPFRVLSINDIHCIPSSIKGTSDLDILKARQCWQSENYKAGIKHLYDLRADDFDCFSPVLASNIKYFCEHIKHEARYRIGTLCFKFTGKILKECFPFTDYLVKAMDENKITKEECCLLMGIISEESKFLDHRHYNLVSPTAVGIFQLHPNEVKKLFYKKKKTFILNNFLHDADLQTQTAIDLLRYHKSFVKNSTLFSVFYYVSGHKSYTLQNKLKFFKFNSALFGSVILANLIYPETRHYVISVLEFFMLIYFLHYDKLPSLSMIF